MKTNERLKKRESPSGFHFYHAYADCPRKWYLKYVCGFKPQYTGKHLIFGGVVHEAIEAFYRALVKGEDAAGKMIDLFKEEIKSRKEEYENVEDFEKDLYRGPLMLDVWASRQGLNDLEEFEVLSIEEELTLQLGGGETVFDFTVRPDRVFKKRVDGSIYVVDTKTTGWSMPGALKGAVCQDQMTSYVWALQQQGLKCSEAIIDVIYMRGKNIDTNRSDPLFFPKYALDQFELGMFGLINEVSLKHQKLATTPHEILFPRFGESCMKFGCVYSEICRQNMTPGNLPYSFVLDEWYIEDDMKKAQRVFGGGEG